MGQIISRRTVCARPKRVNMGQNLEKPVKTGQKEAQNR
jgi:hypothetical protein